MNRARLLQLVDGFWLIGLVVFILAGMMLASFHGDEAMQIYMSRDYATAFINHQPDLLTAGPPYNIDEDNWLRILNGSINRYAIGLSWQIAGLNTGMLPPHPGWDWGQGYDANVQTGHRPSDALLAAGRISSTLFLAASAAVMFAVGWQFGKRPTAYLASALYALNPIILLNGRRAMMEGSLLCFGLLAILIAIFIAQGRRGWGWYLLLGFCCGLALVSKHTGALFIAGAFGWIALTELLSTIVSAKIPSQNRFIGLLLTALKLTISGLIALMLFIACSPALWSDPIARLGDLVAQRQMLLDIQVAVAGGNATTFAQRLEGILTQPFMTSLSHFEVAFWAGVPTVENEIANYMNSPLSGFQFGLILGGLLTLLSGVGILAVLRRWRSWEIGLFVWLGITLASLLINPLPWQRYYLPLIPISSLLAAIAITALSRWLQTRFRQPRVQPVTES